MSKRVIIVGAGPAGLAAASELVTKGHRVIVLEQDPEYVGGLARTIRYKEFRFDIGAHRFFSKNPKITRWWQQRLGEDFISLKRLTRIHYRGRLFHYPLNARDALRGLGVITSTACVASYLWSRMFPRCPEKSFEDWVVNRFGARLFRIFFKSYTEKVWGRPCAEINADWASQRIKGLSLTGAIADAFGLRSPSGKPTTLVDNFEYPKLGAGQMWERTRDEIVQQGGQVLMDRRVVSIHRQDNRIIHLTTESRNGATENWSADEFIVSLPLRDCVLSMHPALDARVQKAAMQLDFRDFILVGLVVNRSDLFPDHWVYIHDSEVQVSRIENLNNWGTNMVPNRDLTCLGMEYFCSANGTLWQQSDARLIDLAKRELERLGFAKAAEVIDGCVVRVEKAYPVYHAGYQEAVDTIRQALAGIENMQVIGRNGMHKYNNQDHSMLTGMLAALNLCGENHDVWQVNTDAEYHEKGEV